MRTYELTRRFRRDFERLTPGQQAALCVAVANFVADRISGKLRGGLRVKAIRGAAGIDAMTWAPDGRATFEYGRGRRAGEAHIVWHRCGSHDILSAP